jgi:hypothetical protein
MDIQQRFKDLQARAAKVTDGRIRAEEKLKSAKERLQVATQKSREAGYPDPRKLPEIIPQMTAELVSSLDQIEKELTSQESILSSIEA